MTTKIDWDSFKHNVKNHMKRKDCAHFPDRLTQDLSPREMHEIYIGTEEDGHGITKQQADEFSVPTGLQPTQEQYDVLLDIIRVYLKNLDQQYFFSSMEGDYCDWTINTAGRIERREPLIVADWQTVLGILSTWKDDLVYSDLPENAEGFFIDHCLKVEEARDLMRKISDLAIMASEQFGGAPSIFNTVLC